MGRLPDASNAEIPLPSPAPIRDPDRLSRRAAAARRVPDVAHEGEGLAARMFAAARTDDGAASGRGLRLGWKASLFVNVLLLLAPTGFVIALPPVLDCRAHAERFGFFAGETAGACAERGIRLRLKRLDDRVKMLVRGSGA